MSEIRSTLFVGAVTTALALLTVGCGERTETPAPPKAAERATAPPPTGGRPWTRWIRRTYVSGRWH